MSPEQEQQEQLLDRDARGENFIHIVFLLVQEGPFDSMFVMRHTANCTFSMVEETAIPFTGYLPQVA